MRRAVRMLVALCPLLGGAVLAPATGQLSPTATAAADSAASDTLIGEERGLISSTLAKANPIAAGGQTVEAVKWTSRRHNFTMNGVPYGFTGLPVVNYIDEWAPSCWWTE